METQRKEKKIAFFKRAACSTFPRRCAPKQCISICHKCLDEPELATIEKDMLDIYSYDNILTHKKNLLSPYKVIQYHPGQIDVLTKTLDAYPDLPVIYIVATDALSDIQYLNSVFEQTMLPKVFRLIKNDPKERDNFIDTIKIVKRVMVPVKPNLDNFFEVEREHVKDVFDITELETLLKLFCGHEGGFPLNPIIVPIIMTKDHQDTSLVGLGAFCIQILMPFPMENFLSSSNVAIDRISNLTAHISNHFLCNGLILPTHLVAFVILNLNREQGVTREDLVEYLDWFRKISMEIEMRLGFTGSSGHAVDYSLVVLKKYLRYDQREESYLPKDISRLFKYAEFVIPLVAYYCFITRAILIEFNRLKAKIYTEVTGMDYLCNYIPDVLIKVEKDAVIRIATNLAENFEPQIVLPCGDLKTKIDNALDHMTIFWHYLKIEEPKIKTRRVLAWAGECESDSELYYDNADNPAYKTWIVVTGRPYRLDCLNLLLNALQYFC